MVGLTEAQGAIPAFCWLEKKGGGGAQASEVSKEPWREGRCLSVAPDFLRVFRECVLMALALGFWACGNKIVAPTRHTWSDTRWQDETMWPGLPGEGRNMHRVVLHYPRQTVLPGLSV